MKHRVLSLSVKGMIISLLSIAFLVPACWAARPVVNSAWASTPPIIDGRFTPGEWYGPQIIMTVPPWELEACAYFMNDDLNLYVMVDAVGDTTDNAGDLSYLVLDFKNQKGVSVSGTDGSSVSNGYTAVVGYSTSPNGDLKHKMYEFRIPLSYFNARSGYRIDLCSPRHGKPSIAYDSQTGRDNIWPVDLDYVNQEKWGILALGTRGSYVGGTIMPTNQLLTLAPYFATIGLVATTAAIKKKRKHAQA